MTRGFVLTGVLTAAVALGAAPAFAQRTNSGDTTGSAVPREGGSSGASGSGSADTSGRSTGFDSSPAPLFESVSGQRSRGGEPSGGRAVPRDSGGSGSDRSAGSGSSRSGGSSTASEPSGRAVPASRPRDGRAATGAAVERRGARPGEIRGGGYSYYSGYPYGRYYWPSYGFGLGYYYDPLWYDPFYFGYYGGGYGPGYGYGGPYGYGGGYGGGTTSSYGSGPTGAVRLKVKPTDAQVYVDGYYVGTVDDFDGIFQKLELEAGGRRIEIRAEGHEVAAFDVLITPGETVTYKGELNRR